MKRDIWPGYVSHEDCTPWICPTCRQGAISIVEGSFLSAKTAETKAFEKEEVLEPYWITYVFTAHGQCSYASCNEEFILSGKGRVVESYNANSDLYEDQFTSIFTPEYICPMPHMILIPEETPLIVIQNLESSFNLFLQDPYASAGKIRIAVEGLMDFLNVPKEKKSTRGKIIQMTLHERLIEFKKENPKIGDNVIALKWLGNSGSHLSAIEKHSMQDDVLTALEIIEYCLEELIEGRSEVISKKATELEARHKRK